MGGENLGLCINFCEACSAVCWNCVSAGALTVREVVERVKDRAIQWNTKPVEKLFFFVGR